MVTDLLFESLMLLDKIFQTIQIDLEFLEQMLNYSKIFQCQDHLATDLFFESIMLLDKVFQTIKIDFDI